ncbi:MAG: response regulator [Faecalibacterium sp.]
MKYRNNTEMRIALASYDPREIRVQKHYLQEQAPGLRISGYQSGKELLDTLKEGVRFDVIVLGSQLEDMDEVQFLQNLRPLGCKPLLLLFDEGCRRSDLADSLCPGSRRMHASLQELMQELSQLPGYPGHVTDSQLNRMYAKWGVPRQDANCGYFSSALRIACSSERKLAIRKEILQAVSEQERVSVAAVDSGIRRMVDELEEAATPGWLAFKQKFGFGKARPTTGKLIYAAKQYLLSGKPQK